MARNRFDDGLDRVERIDSSVLTLDDLRAWVSGTGFEGMIRNVTESLHTFETQHPERMGDFNDPLSPARRARQIRWRIRVLRQILRDDPAQERAVCMALYLGSLIADHAWRVNRGKSTRSGNKKRASAARAARLSVVARRGHYPQIRELFQELRTKQPYDRDHSTSWISKQIARRLKRDPRTDGTRRPAFEPETVRRILGRLGLK